MAEPEQKNYFNVKPGDLTCKTNVEGLAFDFNYGARVQVPEGKWRVRLIDCDADITLYDAEAENAIVTCNKKYFVNFRIEIEKEGKKIFEHDYDAEGKKILIKFPVGTLGDIIAWFPYAMVFKYKHKCEIYCAMASEIANLLKPSYPELKFVEPEYRPSNLYATYYMGIFFPCDDRNHQPVDWRIVGLQKTIPYILGLDVKEIRPEIKPSKLERPIKEKYVCIATQATSQAKYWTNPTGWMETIEHLKQKGYRVLCIDKEKCHGEGANWNTIPYGAEDFTGAKPLIDRVNLIYHADFFIGLASGLSWLAWAVGKPVILISGFSLPVAEFETAYRIINYHVCNGCWTDSAIEFEHQDFGWCPKHKGTARQHECTRKITAGQVRQAVERLMKENGLEEVKKKMNGPRIGQGKQ